MVFGIGETILDIIFRNDIPQKAIPGGSTFNAMISLGRCHVPCQMLTEVGDDHVGDIISRYMTDNHVGTDYVNRNKGTQSHVSLAFLDANNDAQYQFYKDHAHASVAPCMPAITKDDIILFGSFFAINPVVRPTVLPILQQAHEAGATIYYDVNFRPTHIKDLPIVADNIHENMTLATVVRGSLDDFRFLYGTDDVDRIYQQHIRPCCQCFICTDGANKVQVRIGDEVLSFDTPHVETVSTIGAGDNFNAGFIYKKYTDHLDIRPQTMPLLIASGLQFASEVCQTFENSIKGYSL